MKKFNSKAGFELVIPVAVIIGWLFYISIAEKDWMGVIVAIILAAFFLYIFISTRYIICENKLEVKAGIFYYKCIEISSIKKITTVTDFFGAPATSIKRIQILFNETNSVAISPADKKGFIQALININPAIEIKQSDE